MVDVVHVRADVAGQVREPPVHDAGPAVPGRPGQRAEVVGREEARPVEGAVLQGLVPPRQGAAVPEPALRAQGLLEGADEVPVPREEDAAAVDGRGHLLVGLDEVLVPARGGGVGGPGGREPGEAGHAVHERPAVLGRVVAPLDAGPGGRARRGGQGLPERWLLGLGVGAAGCPLEGGRDRIQAGAESLQDGLGVKQARVVHSLLERESAEAPEAVQRDG